MLAIDVQKCPFLKVFVVLWLHMGCQAQHLQQDKTDPCARRAGHVPSVLQHLSSCLPHPTRLGLDRQVF